MGILVEAFTGMRFNEFLWGFLTFSHQLGCSEGCPLNDPSGERHFWAFLAKKMAKNGTFQSGRDHFRSRPPGMVLMVPNYSPPIGALDPRPKTPPSKAFWVIF